jgi:hypothetical protein
MTIDGISTVLPWEAALEVAQGLRAKAKQAEEEQKALGIIADHAILLRAGVPMGLTSRPDMIQEVVKEALYNRDLRRYMPSIRSKEVFGTPTIIRGKPRG